MQNLKHQDKIKSNSSLAVAFQMNEINGTLQPNDPRQSIKN